MLARELVEISPKEDNNHISILNKEKVVDVDDLSVFLDGVSKLKALQEEESKLIEDLVP